MTLIRRDETFKAKCIKSAKLAGLPEPNFYIDQWVPLVDAFEDDGTLHIHIEAIRACFDVSNGQEDSGSEQNRKTRAVLEAMNMRRWIEAALVEQEDEGEEEHSCDCEYCTR